MAWWLYLYAAVLGAVVFSCSCADPERYAHDGVISYNIGVDSDTAQDVSEQ